MTFDRRRLDDGDDWTTASTATIAWTTAETATIGRRRRLDDGDVGDDDRRHAYELRTYNILKLSTEVRHRIDQLLLA